MDTRPLRLWTLGIVWITLALFASYLAVHRVYQVDEAQNLFMARVIATHRTGAYFSSALLWMLGPLSWVTRLAPDSASMFLGGRLIFLGVFLLNIILLALNTGVRLRSEAGLVALLGATTLAPLWDYGFEIRHDNLILTSLLLMWWLGRVRPRGRSSYAAIGFLSVLMIFAAFKAFAYVLPMSAALLVFPPPGHGKGRLKFLVFWMIGGVAAGFLAFLLYRVSGTWPLFLAGFRGGAIATENAVRFGPGIALDRLLVQTPLLLGLACGALVSLGLSIRRSGNGALSWDGPMPEAILLLGSLGLLLVNPTPFPYNLVNLVPFAFLLAYRFIAPHMDKFTPPFGTRALLLSVVLFTHVVPFAMATLRHLDWTNDRQKLLMNTAEAMTDPVKDPVYDAIGMVTSRESIGYYWFLHSLNLRYFEDGQFPSVPQMLKAHPAAVLIPSYRTDWLSKANWDFIRSRYVPLSDDFWVLGQVLPAGGGTYDVVHGGRYQVVGLVRGVVEPLNSGTLDGKPLLGAPVQLDLGVRRFECPPDVQPVIVWVGPHLENIPQIGPGDHRHLFVNWY